MIKLCVFDLDGTLVNSLDDLAESTNYALRKNGFKTYEHSKYKYFVGDGIKVLVKRVLGGNATPETEEAVLADFNLHYNLHYADNTKPYDGCEKMLKKLSEKGINCAVLSNKPDNFVKIIVSKLYPDFKFSWVQGKAEGFPKKPDPTALKFILKSLKTDLEDTLYIGDSNVDIFTGKNAGVKTCGVTWGFRDRDELEAAVADYIIDKPEEIFRNI